MLFTLKYHLLIPQSLKVMFTEVELLIRVHYSFFIEDYSQFTNYFRPLGQNFY